MKHEGVIFNITTKHKHWLDLLSRINNRERSAALVTGRVVLTNKCASPQHYSWYSLSSERLVDVKVTKF
jgi:hypothetical protein